MHESRETGCGDAVELQTCVWFFLCVHEIKLFGSVWHVPRINGWRMRWDAFGMVGFGVNLWLDDDLRFNMYRCIVDWAEIFVFGLGHLFEFVSEEIKNTSHAPITLFNFSHLMLKDSLTLINCST